MVLNAASMTPGIAPGGYATLFGVGLANCTAASDTQTLPGNLFGTGVTFTGIPAPLTYASPGQINVLVPRALAVQHDATVALTGGPERCRPRWRQPTSRSPRLRFSVTRLPMASTGL